MLASSCIGKSTVFITRVTTRPPSAGQAATLYYSAGMVPVLVAGLHPVVALAWIIDCAVGAWLGHDGFQVRTLMQLRNERAIG